MTTSLELLTEEIEYPDSDGQPMAEGDIQCDYLIYARQALRIYFQSRLDVYVAGNLCIYYEQGNPKAVVDPDTFVVFGVASTKRRSYKVWQEAGKTPDFALEITSESTKKEDQVTKPTLYAALGVREYFQFDPTGDYLHPQLQGWRLIDGTYQAMAPTVASEMLSISSQVLGLDLHLQNGDLRFYDPLTEQVLLAHEEERQARLQAEKARSQAEQARSQAEQARSQAERRSHQLAERLRQLNIDPDAL